MGYDYKEYTVCAHVSRHNSPKDEEHDALWAEMIERIKKIVNDPKYQPIDPW